MYANVRGIKGKITSLSATLHEYEPQIFLMSETQLRTDTGLRLDGYTLYSRCRKNGSGGGVAVLVRNDVVKNIAPHISDRNIELIWISVRRKHRQPIFVGCYYGKQECRVSSDEITQEMSDLQEEITEMKKEGDIFLAMDGNGKIGILGEAMSRNGKLLKQVFDNTNLIVMNKSEKCHGSITRRNTGNEHEFSAIDFIVATENVEKCIEKVLIDEDGLALIKGKKNSDHNTIISTLSVGSVDKPRVVKRSKNLLEPESFT